MCNTLSVSCDLRVTFLVLVNEFLIGVKFLLGTQIAHKSNLESRYKNEKNVWDARKYSLLRQD